jgi:hypothetical protein
MAQNPDSAWLSQHISGYPKLSSYELSIDSSAEFNMMLKTASDSAASVMFPLYYDPNEIQLLAFEKDTMSFPFPVGWNFFEKDTIFNDSGRFMIYAWTSAYTISIPPGVHRIGTFSIQALDSAETEIAPCWYPPSGQLIYSHGPSATDYYPDWLTFDLDLIFENPDTAWLSDDASGLPVLTDVEFMGSELKTFHMILKNDSMDFHAVQYPLCYDTSALTMMNLEFDTLTFPSPVAWNFFLRDTVYNDLGRLMLYAWTSAPAIGVPTGINRIGWVDFQSIQPTGDSTVTIIDTCWYPPEGHLYYSNALTALDYWPYWVPVDVVIQAGICGDTNGDTNVTTADGYRTLNYFGAGPAPSSCWAANVNGDGNLTTADGFHLLNWFGAGPALNCAPCP